MTSTTDITICNSQLPYSWNGNSYPTAGTYSVTLISSAGCDSIATLHLIELQVTTSMSAVTICSNVLPYNWNGQDYTTPGIYTTILIGNNGCDSIATLNLMINISPVPPSVSSPVSYCQYAATIALAANVTTTGNQLTWYNSASGGIGSVTAPIPSSSAAGTVNYYVSQQNGVCESPRTIIAVIINSKPFVDDQSLRICFNQTANLATLYNSTGYNLNWTFNQQTVPNPASVNNAGTYQLIASGSTGCSDTAFVNLGINPPVIANAGSDDDAEYNVGYQLSGSGGIQYQWTPAAGLNNPFIAAPIATLSHAATYVLMVMDDIGCFAFDTVKLRVLNGPTLYVPTAFTPNGDGLNDLFRPIAIGISSLEYFSVFNRYGELVFETHEFKKGWDGTYKGKKQPLDNYVWKLKAVDRSGKVRTMSGNVVLIR